MLNSHSIDILTKLFPFSYQFTKLQHVILLQHASIHFFNPMKFCLFLIALTLFLTSKAKHPHDSNLSVEGDSLIFRIEIPAGIKQKWEFNDETGEIEKDYKDGKERIIQFLP